MKLEATETPTDPRPEEATPMSTVDRPQPRVLPRSKPASDSTSRRSTSGTRRWGKENGPNWLVE